MFTSPSRGRFAGTNRKTAFSVITAVVSPAIPPMKASNSDSVSICRIILPPLAPIAARTAISCCRPEARARSRLPMFRDTTKTIKITAAINTTSIGRTLPTNDCCNGTISTVHLACGG